MRHQHLLANLSVILVLGVGAAAANRGGTLRPDEPAPPSLDGEQTSVTYAGALRTTGTTRVIGTVIDIRQAPVPNAPVQLRNLDTGKVEQEAYSNDLGRYEFAVEGSGTYLVEMVTVEGTVLALSNAGSLLRDETLQTVIQLPGRWDFASGTMIFNPNISTFFGISSRTTMTALTIQIAMEQRVAPADPGVPVSPSTPSS